MKEKTVEKMYVIAVVGQKGGIGKTTLSIHLAVAAALAGHTTLLIDLDPQASASKWSDIRQDASPVVISAHASRLRPVLEKAEEQGVTFVILNTPPQLESPISDAAKVADLALIPCRPALFDIHAIEETVYRTQKENVPTHIVFNAVPPGVACSNRQRRSLRFTIYRSSLAPSDDGSSFHMPLWMGKPQKSWIRNPRQRPRFRRFISILKSNSQQQRKSDRHPILHT